MTFKDGNTILGTASLNGSCVATWVTSALSVGNHAITATYGGTTDLSPSAGSITQAVKKAKK